MHTVTTREDAGALVDAWKRVGETLAFVPTMGDLHDGHLRLITEARRRADRVAVSIFVNPLQFNDPADFLTYPRAVDEDVARLDEAGIDLLFLPTAAQMYPHRSERGVVIEMPGLSDILCGQFRPGHFSGVANVVAILFNIIRPDCALFGSKDYQQLLVVRRLVEDLAFPLRIDAVETVRETDGLAMSSRNRHLAPEERRQAPELYRALSDARERWMAGDRDLAGLEAGVRRRLENAGFRPDYISIRRADDLAVPDSGSNPGDDRLIMLAAAWLGKTRLIDNLPF